LRKLSAWIVIDKYQKNNPLICNILNFIGVKPLQKEMPTEKKLSRLSNLAILLSACLFVIVLIVSAWFDRSIRVLHAFEALPFLVSPWLCHRRPKLGYMLAFVCGAFWIWTAGFLTTFIRNGFERVIIFIQAGTVDRPDILLAVPGFIGTFGLVVFSLIGYWKLDNKDRKDFLILIVMFAAVFLFFVLIFALFMPQYLGMFKWMIGR